MNKKIIPAAGAAVLLITATLYFDVCRKGGDNPLKIEGTGTIEVTEINISSMISGKIIDLPRAEGESVKKGDVLARIEADELSAMRHSAIANLKNAAKNFKRVQGLFSSGSVSRRDYDNAETVYRMAAASFDQISATVSNAVINSPIDGTLLNVNIEAGETAFPGTPIVTVADLSKAYMYVYVDEKKLGRVKIGQRADIYVDSFPKKPFPGRVSAISNKAEFTPKTIQTKEERVKLVFAVKIAVDNADQSLKPGMPADAVISVKEEKK